MLIFMKERIEFTLLFYLLNAVICQTDSLSFTNSLGMKMRKIPAGTFLMGQENEGDFDERPVHSVTIPNSFFISATEVTNVQYEAFDSDHRQYRGKYGLSQEDDEAVIFVTRNEAIAFCEWLSQKEGKTYRLPTEAEWEYACRAGTNTKYYNGDQLPEIYFKNQRETWSFEHVSLKVATTSPNAWGLYDMHGNAEEWCLDWYGIYQEGERTAPIGYANGDFKVTRGGSHSTDVHYLRSPNRSGALPHERHPLIGFRVVCAEMPTTEPLTRSDVPLWARDVSQKRYDWQISSQTDSALFIGPKTYVKIPPGLNGPLFIDHNHCPALTVCPNGDLLAIWYTTKAESGRELAIAASRLRKGAVEWDEASLFWDSPDRNDHASDLLWDGENTLYHFNGLSSDATWGKLILIMRTSTNNGVTWSKAQILNPEYGLRNQVIAGGFITSSNRILLRCDAVTEGNGGTVIHLLNLDGSGWFIPCPTRLKPTFKEGETGAWIAGIHAGVVELNNGKLLALGRGDNINGRMPQSISTDMGRSWTYSASEFPPISGGQRLALLRLQEGPLLLVSFTGTINYEDLAITDQAGRKVYRHGLFAALSYDEGQTWPIKKLISDFGDSRVLNGGAWTDEFIMNATNAEPKGYIVAKQAPNGIIHLLSSALHYQFNLKWLLEPMPGMDIK
jgi:sulfatase modifying factor 1